MTKHIRLGSQRIQLPASASLRIAIGIVLIVGGTLGFLPILGFWMIPLGLLILSIDLPFVRRLRRRAEVWLWRRWNGPWAYRIRRALAGSPPKSEGDSR